MLISANTRQPRVALSAANFATLLLICAIVGGCASKTLRPGADDPATVTASINLSGFPPEYKRGFSAGCHSARDAPARPARHQAGDASFVQGWRDGLDYCRSRPPR